MHQQRRFTAKLDPLRVTQQGGTGSFGKTMLRGLLAEGVSHIRILSRDEEKQDALRAELRDDRVRYYIGDIRDPEVWKRVDEGLDPELADPVFVIGSGLDRANLRLALTLRARYPESVVVGRSERPWAFAEAFSADAGYGPATQLSVYILMFLKNRLESVRLSAQ